jgi:ubiquinone/menaquinone biosynthesis C-methylase UbiE
MDPKFYREYYTLEREHWWFTARLGILEKLVQSKIANQRTDLKILNVGVATGATSEMLAKYGEVTSVEYDQDCCDFLLEKTGIEAINASLTELPFEDNSYDLVCAFDVIEHIEDDSLAVSEINRVLKPEAKYFVTVPAFQFLWSNHDVVNHHFRRYKKGQLNGLFSSNGCKIEFSSYFNFWLFFPIAAVRVILNLLPSRKKESSSGSDNEVMSSSKILNKILFTVFSSEKGLLSTGIKFPLGISIVSLGSKRPNE